MLRAQALATTPAEEAHVETHLGEVAAGKLQHEEALSHFQRVAELEPENADAWTNLAQAYENLENLAMADANYRRAIGLASDVDDLYYNLSNMYGQHGQPEKAMEIIQEGLHANPDSAVLNVYLASLYMDKHDYRQAEIFLSKAEELDPELEVIPMFRYTLNILKAQAALPPGKLGRSGKKKKK